MSFDVLIPAEDWSRIKPIEVIYQKNTYQVLKPWAWTKVIIRRISASDYPLPCAFSFLKGHTVYKNFDEPFFRFSARCRECDTFMTGTCGREFNIGSPEVSVKIDTYDTRVLSHSKKTFFSGVARSEGQKVLNFATALQFRSEEVGNKIAEFGNPEPPDLHTTKVFRDARAEEGIGCHRPP